MLSTSKIEAYCILRRNGFHIVRDACFIPCSIIHCKEIWISSTNCFKTKSIFLFVLNIVLCCLHADEFFESV